MQEHEFLSESEQSTLEPTELHTEDELTAFWLVYRRNYNLTLPDAKREERSARAQAKESMKDLANKNDPKFFYTIQDNNQVIATGRLSFNQNEDGSKHAYLSGLTVNPEYRGQNIAQKLVEIRTTKAKEEGCTHIDTEVYAENPQALVTKLNDGFSIVAGRYDNKKLYGFLLSKKIDDEPEFDKKDKIGQIQEINLGNREKIGELLEDGWVGIDLKNLEKSDNSDSSTWMMILEKESTPA